VNTDHWSKKEKKIARQAFERAYQKECTILIERVRKMTAGAKTPDALWEIHDFLSKRRQEIDDKYDYRYSVLHFVFARLLSEGWMDESDLEGLEEAKVARIKFIVDKLYE
jgi:hypothetical protein